MKLFTFLFFITSFLCAGQVYKTEVDEHDHIVIKELTCEEIKEKAVSMAANNQYRSVSYGFISPKSHTDGHFIKQLYSRFNIVTETKGCAVSPTDICYATAMNDEIDKKFGKGFIDEQYELYLASLKE